MGWNICWNAALCCAIDSYDTCRRVRSDIIKRGRGGRGREYVYPKELSQGSADRLLPLALQTKALLTMDVEESRVQSSRCNVATVALDHDGSIVFVSFSANPKCAAQLGLSSSKSTFPPGVYSAALLMDYLRDPAQISEHAALLVLPLTKKQLLAQSQRASEAPELELESLPPVVPEADGAPLESRDPESPSYRPPVRTAAAKSAPPAKQRRLPPPEAEAPDTGEEDVSPAFPEPEPAAPAQDDPPTPVVAKQGGSPPQPVSRRPAASPSKQPISRPAVPVAPSLPAMPAVKAASLSPPAAARAPASRATPKASPLPVLAVDPPSP